MPTWGTIVIAVENVELGEGTVGSLVAGPYIKVSVSDTGSGMPPEVAARAFEPFFTTKEFGKGTGLGRSQVYGFIAQSGGGDVLFETEPDNGAVRGMYLPVLRDQSGDTDSLARPALDTVLVVEDEPDLLDATAELFRSRGYDVLTASNETEAMDAPSRRDDIHIFFTDVVMPKGGATSLHRRCIRGLVFHVSGDKLIIGGGTKLAAPTSVGVSKAALENVPHLRHKSLACRLRAAVSNGRGQKRVASPFHEQSREFPFANKRL
jgi:hypothetical protein